MRTLRFENWIPHTLEWETEYNENGSVRVENDPDDPGGTTKYGIDQRSHQHVNIQKLTLEEAKQIYFDDEWTTLRIEELPLGLGEVVFDVGVNAGKGEGVKVLQEAVGATIDGILGPKTIAAAQYSGESVIKDISDTMKVRTNFYRDLAARRGRLRKFLRGWLNRVEGINKAASAIAAKK